MHLYITEMAYLISMMTKLIIFIFLLVHQNNSINSTGIFKSARKFNAILMHVNKFFKAVSPSAVRIWCDSGFQRSHARMVDYYAVQLIAWNGALIYPPGCTNMSKNHPEYTCIPEYRRKQPVRRKRRPVSKTFMTVPLARSTARASEIMECSSESRNSSGCELLFPRLHDDRLYYFTIIQKNSMIMNTISGEESMFDANTSPVNTSIFTKKHRGTIAAARTFKEPGSLNINHIQSTSANVAFNATIPCPPIRCGMIVQVLFRYSLCSRCMYLSNDAILSKIPPTSDIQQVIIATNKQMVSKQSSPGSNFEIIDRLITDLSPNSVYYYHFLILYNTNIMYLQDHYKFRTPAGVPGSPDRPQIIPKADGSFKIEWAAPSYFGGDPIWSYDLIYKVESLTELEEAKKKWMTIIVNQTRDEMSNNSFVFKLDKKCNNCIISAKVAARNSVGKGNFSKMASTNTGGENDSLNSTVISVIAISMGAALLMMGILTFYCCRNNIKSVGKNTKFHLPPIVLPKDLACLPQITSEQTKICEKLGEGNFGTIYAGIAYGLSPGIGKARKVALKMLKKDATLDQRNEIIKEALTMRNLHHPNVLGLLGLCTDEQKFWLVLEFMDSGDLAQYLRKLRPQGSIPSQVNLTDLVRMVKQVADGATYLEKMGYTHRDLAARNILVNGRDPELCHLKIADFGLTRGLYKKRYYRMNEQSLVPVSWTAPEVFQNKFCDSKSDTWAFGIVVWEIISLGETPYAQLTLNQVGNFVQNGGTEVPPTNCGNQLSQVMIECWEINSITRKSLSEITSQISKLTDTLNDSDTNDELDWSEPFSPILLPLRLTKTQTVQQKLHRNEKVISSQEPTVSSRTPGNHNHETVAGYTETIPLQPINFHNTHDQNAIHSDTAVCTAILPFQQSQPVSPSSIPPDPLPAQLGYSNSHTFNQQNPINSPSKGNSPSMIQSPSAADSEDRRFDQCNQIEIVKTRCSQKPDLATFPMNDVETLSQIQSLLPDVSNVEAVAIDNPLYVT